LNTPDEQAARVLAADGPLAPVWPHWRARAGQIDMARAVADTLAQGGVLVIEAGTGVGKTLAYLVPLLLAGQRAIVSTSTHDLQDQLVSRDIPALSRALALHIDAVALKGRSAYVCLHRVQQALLRAPLPGEVATHALLHDLLRWAESSADGDLATFGAIEPAHALWPRVTSTRENCLGADCPRQRDCHVDRARRAASRAEWVVINHHVFFADLVLREAGAPSLLPQAQAVVFDEAHGLDDLGVAHLGHTVGSRALRSLATDLAIEGPAWARGGQPWSLLALDVERASRDMGELLRLGPVREGRAVWPPVDAGAAARWRAVHQTVHRALQAAHQALAHGAHTAPALTALHRRARGLLEAWRGIAADAASPPAGGARWVERGGDGAWQLVASPADSAALFAPLLAAGVPGPRSWVFTSATLGLDDALGHFTEPLGLAERPGLRTQRVASPIDHAAQAALHVPDDLPEPGDEAHTPALALRVAAWASRLGGRTLVLTTTLRAAHRLGATLRQASTDGQPLQVLVQGAASRRELLRRFRAADAAPATPSVLVASAAFWRGIDLPGDTLQLLVIDKLPFAPPDDPLVQGRAARVQARGGRPFEEVHLAGVALALRQGVGRLIRTERDRGLLVIGDKRLLQRSYGPALLAGLPAMRWLADDDQVSGYLDELVLTRASTTGCLPA